MMHAFITGFYCPTVEVSFEVLSANSLCCFIFMDTIQTMHFFCCLELLLLSMRERDCWGMRLTLCGIDCLERSGILIHFLRPVMHGVTCSSWNIEFSEGACVMECYSEFCGVCVSEYVSVIRESGVHELL